jgi:hypothetical protein
VLIFFVHLTRTSKNAYSTEVLQPKLCMNIMLPCVLSTFPPDISAIMFHLSQVLTGCFPPLSLGTDVRNQKRKFPCRYILVSPRSKETDCLTGSRDSVAGIATGYGLDDLGVGVRVPVGSRIFSSPQRPDRLWGPPSLLYNGHRGFFSRGSSGRGVGLYIQSPIRLHGFTLPLP